MNTNKTQIGLAHFDELAQEVVRQQKAKRDFVGDPKLMALNPDSQSFHLKTNGHFEDFRIADSMHKQLGNKLGIPGKYYDRMRHEQPELLAANVNVWLQNEPQKKMIRTLDGTARAFLSNAYRPLDNFDLMNAILPTLRGFTVNGLEIRDCGLTECRMYLKATVKTLTAEVRLGDTVEAGIVISNSEIGEGSLRVEPLIFRLACLNGLISQHSICRYHVGRRMGEDDGRIEEFFSDQTKHTRDQAFWMQVRDVVKGTLGDGKWFSEEVNKLKSATEQMISKPKAEVIEIAQKKFGFNTTETESILESLIKSGDYSKYGLANAVTFTAQGVPDYDRRIDLERTGSDIIELPTGVWAEMAN